MKHGFLRTAFDVDLVLAMNDDKLARFIAVAKRFGLTPGLTRGDWREGRTLTGAENHQHNGRRDRGAVGTDVAP